MENRSQDQHDALQSNLRWSPGEESIFLDMLVEEFISKQPEAMDALVALVLFRISKITDEGWNRVAIKFAELTGKKYTMGELKEQMKRFTRPFQCLENLFGLGGPGINFPHSTFDPFSECKENSSGSKSPDENVTTPEKDAGNSDGFNVSIPYPEDCVRESNRSSRKGSHQEGDPDMPFPRTTCQESFETENDGGISWPPDENFLFPEKKERSSDECNGSINHPEESLQNSDRSCDNASCEESQTGLDFPCAAFVPYFEHDNDAGVYWSPDVPQQEDGPALDSPYATFEPYFEHYNVERVYWSPDGNVPYSGDCDRNSIRSSGNGSHQDGVPGIRRSPVEIFSIPEKEDIISDECHVSVPYPDTNVRDFNGSSHKISHQEGGSGRKLKE